MNQRELDPVQLRKSMRFALDLLTAHRIAKGLTINQERMTAMRELLEERVLLSIAELEQGSMPSTWSWERAAEKISTQIALAIIQEQRYEPPTTAV